MKFPPIKKIKSFLKAQKEIARVQKKARDVRKITDETTLSVASEVLVDVVKVLKITNYDRLEEGKPYREHSDKISTEFNELLSPLEGIKAKLDEEISAYQAKKQEKVEKERERLEKLAEKRQERENKRAARAGRDPIQHSAPEIPDAPTTIKTAGGGQIQVKTLWKYEIEDEKELPRRFLKPDKDAINKAVKGGARNIPGVRIFPDNSNAIKV